MLGIDAPRYSDQRETGQQDDGLRQRGRNTTPLAELIATAACAQAAFISAQTNAVEHAITAGKAFNEMEAQNLVPHGQWEAVYRKCGADKRTAQRHRQLARLVAANASSTTHLTGLTIEQAIRKLSPKKPPKTAATPRTPQSKKTRASTHTDILEIWMRGSPTERERAVNALGLRGWIAAMPESWRAEAARLLATAPIPADTATVAVAEIPADLSVPPALRRVA